VNVSSVSELIDALASLDCGNETVIEMNPATTLYVLTDVYDSSFFGDNGLPIIYCNVTINGNGTTLTRSNSAPPFRLFGVDSGGSLTINDLALTNGKPSETGGGAILSVGGAVNVNRSYVLNNVIDFETGWQTLGAGIYVYYGSLSITDSEIAGNQNLAGNASENLGDGGGVASINGTVALSGVNFHDNAVSRDGSAAAILDNSTVDGHISYSCIVGNAGLSVYANWGLDAASNWWGNAAGPLVDQPSTGTRDSVNSTVTASSPLNARPDCGVPPPVCGSFALNSLAARDNCPTSTPTPTPTLADYGIVITDPQNWTSADEAAILAAANETGNALLALGIGSTPIEAFRRVLEGMNGGSWRQIQFSRISGGGIYCTTTPNPSSGISGLIECDTRVVMNQYTAVHELGHVFDGRTGGAFQASIEDPDGEGSSDRLNNSADEFVMGIKGYALVSGNVIDWQRSNIDTDNGWGSAALWNQYSYWGPYYIPVVPPGPTPTSLAPRLIPQIGPCDDGAPVPTAGAVTPYPTPNALPFAFQQNPCTYPDWIASPGTIVEIHEAAGDMFLNWVYWKNYRPPPSIPVGTPTPSGFWNYTWRSSGCYPNGCPETPPKDSGDTRGNWMDQVVMTLFINNGW
jgi:hypothetical protein